jgi:hypothetical protein
MRRRGKTGGKAVKTQRHKTLTRCNASGGARPRSNGQETNVARELHEARRQQMAKSYRLRALLSDVPNCHYRSQSPCPLYSQKQTFAVQLGQVCFGPIADIN